AAGAESHQHSPNLPPGRGWYRGDLIHIVTTDTSRPAAAPKPTPELPHNTGLIVSTRPAELANRLSDTWGSERIRLLTPSALAGSDTSAFATSAGEHHRVLIADPDSWLARHALFTELGRRHPTAYHACTTAQYRQLSGDRTLPPPLATPHDTMWLAHPTASVCRAALPASQP
ncbi:MAG TPA: hypothetical protein PK890_08785, partial [Terrimesophilobacter sp.]|nr:hypothetical protein [Terrimesophilobacter sp.]